MVVSLISTVYRLGLRKCNDLKFIRHFCTVPKYTSSSTVDKNEVEKFTTLSSHWWNDEKFQTLRSMNTVRVPFIRDGLLAVNGQTVKKPLPLEGYQIIDVGCGGGLLSEPLARLGASVTGLDPGQENVDAATEHASLDDTIKHRVKYVCDTIENVSENTRNKYDALVCSEVIEHVNNPEAFVKSCVEVTKDGGSLFFTTINRTYLSYVHYILGAEYVLGFIPRGTHDWNKFVTPKELCDWLQPLNCRIVSIEGYIMNPVTKKWSWLNNSNGMYALHAVK